MVAPVISRGIKTYLTMLSYTSLSLAGSSNTLTLHCVRNYEREACMATYLLLFSLTLYQYTLFVAHAPELTSGMYVFNCQGFKPAGGICFT